MVSHAPRGPQSWLGGARDSGSRGPPLAADVESFQRGGRTECLRAYAALTFKKLMVGTAAQRCGPPGETAPVATGSPLCFRAKSAAWRTLPGANLRMTHPPARPGQLVTGFVWAKTSTSVHRVDWCFCFRAVCRASGWLRFHRGCPKRPLIRILSL